MTDVVTDCVHLASTQGKVYFCFRHLFRMCEKCAGLHATRFHIDEINRNNPLGLYKPQELQVLK